LSSSIKLNDVIYSRYKITDYIGEGGMQYVYKAYDTGLGRNVALKTPKNSSGEKRFHNSAIYAAKINHPNVAGTFDYFDYEGRSFLIEELVDGLDLSKSILKNVNYLDPHFVSRLFHKIIKGLAASHHKMIIHRDLKPSNIMVSGQFNLDEVKITDFGVSKLAESEIEGIDFENEDSINASATAVGAIPYMAPEAIDSDLNVGLKTDIWSFGAIMYEFLTGYKPFGKGLEAVRNILDGKELRFPEFVRSNVQLKTLSLQLMKIIKSCLEPNYDVRPSADDLVATFSSLCYSTKKMKIGFVSAKHGKVMNFIKGERKDVFFHNNCIYGKHPIVGDRVLFSQYRGMPNDRGFPVVRIKPVSK